MISEALLEVRGLRKRYGRDVTALDGVDLTLQAGKNIAVIGPSGSGKSTLARCVAGFERPDTGAMAFRGGDRTKIQMIFQDPGISLNPRLTAAEIVEEPLLIRGVTREERRQRALDLMRSVGISELDAEKRPGEFSGGQKARLAIARALAADPALLILDETLGNLDLSVRAQVVNLLKDWQERTNLAYLVVTHDTRLATFLADEIVVLREGRIVEAIDESC